MFAFNSVYRAKTVEDAIRTLQDNDGAIIISGGSDILIKIREGKLSNCSLVSIHDIPDLKGIFMDEEGSIHIGAATCFTAITNHPMVQKYIPTLGEAVDQVGGPQIRNMGTIGGNVSNGVTSADSASTLFAYNAKLKLQGSDGIRIIPIQEYYLSAGRVALKKAEILTEIIIEKQEYQNTSGQYIKYAMRNAMDIATLGCAAVCRLTEDKNKIEDIRIAFGVAGPVPMRCLQTEEICKGKKLDNSLFSLIAKSTQAEVNPRTSWRASKEFRLQLVSELSVRAVKSAIVHAGGEWID